MDKFICIVQARLTSQRLPRKVLKKILNYSILEIINKRLLMSKSLNQIIYATPNNSKNESLVKYLKKKNLENFCGSEQNVLERYYFAAKKYKAKYILRVTGDCPFVDSSMVDKMFKIIKIRKVDYISNTNPPTFPDGFDLEIFTFRALEEAYRYSLSSDEKEHVTPYLINSPKISKYNFSNSQDLKDFNLTLDSQKDLKNIKKVFTKFKNILVNKNKIIDYIKKNKEIFKSHRYTKKFSTSNSDTSKHWQAAQKVIPNGNNFLSKRVNLETIKNWPAYYKKAQGCYVWDLDNNKFTDVGLMGVGTNVLGYNNKDVNKAVKQSIDKSNMSTLNCPEEVNLAQKLLKIHPWASKVKFARTGGEANAIAIRIARAFTGSTKVAVCGYHGWHDWYLAANLKNTKSLKNHLMDNLKTSGVPKALANSVFSFEYNDFKTMKRIVEKEKIKIIKLEVRRFDPPKNNFLKKIRDYTLKNNIILIVDECTTGFREILGGLHKKYKINPDIAIFGKAMGNGFAITSVIGKNDIMEKAENSFISSTFWSERSGFVAGLKTIEIMEKKQIAKKINNIGKKIKQKWKIIFKRYKVSITIYGTNVIPAFKINDQRKFNYINYITEKMLEKNFLFKNVVYVSIAHTEKILDKYFKALENVVKNLTRESYEKK
ncbi:MAG: glutamate-1-semialdehyde 2,1-aminomutase [Pelagibacterales bacterium]|nr:glutamate-1-semialdehyde 2,1-aminomutase [Pelagibacterales bacterium]|tara:strand:- start:8963 stop:10933 length:1971 start_codon:yes stop_codon:yes gene_type:complete